MLLAVGSSACIDYNPKSTLDSNPLAALQVDPEIVDFGAVPSGEERAEILTLTNVGDAALAVHGLELDAPGAFTLSADGLASSLEPGESTEAIVTYTPWSMDDAGVVTVYSDDPDRPELDVPVLGQLAEAFLVFSPDPLDFGSISVGADSTQTLTVSNAGTADLEISDMLVTGAEFSAEFPAFPLTLAAGERYELPVTFEPSAAGAFEGRVWATSNDRDGSASVQLLGEGSSAPVAVCSVDPSLVESHDETATWIGDESYDPTGAEIVAWRWTLIEQPDGSTATMPAGTARRRGFAWDLAGTYVGQLVVENEHGVESEPCEATLEAIPADGLWVELYWEHDGDDMDLHLLSPGGRMETDSDCYYGNCVGGGLDWGVRRDRSDDPSLDIDDIPGTGPENTRIDSPEDGTFTVIVNDYPGTVYNGANEVYVNIYVGGVLAWSGSKTISGEDEDVEFATVSFPDGTVTPE